MTSLTDVYEGRIGTVASRQEFYLGAGLFVLGAGLVVAGIVTATTNLPRSVLELGTYEARKLAGLLAGLGLPAVMAGTFTVLPAGRRTTAAAAIGTGVTLFGVALFWHTYPTNWIGGPQPSTGLTLATTVVYFAGAATTTWCLFLAVATFQTRLDPGGTARMELTEEGRIRLVEAADADSNAGRFGGVGGIGLFGSRPDPDVPTQTGSLDGDRGVSGRDTGTAATDAGTAASDGGAAGSDDAIGGATPRGQPDRYCGNCEHFSYVQTDEEIVPYCGLDQRYMEDIDACEEWSANFDETTRPEVRKRRS